MSFGRRVGSPRPSLAAPMALSAVAPGWRRTFFDEFTLYREGQARGAGRDGRQPSPVACAEWRI